MANTNLKEAKAAKNDEFYTQFHDIEIEMNMELTGIRFIIIPLSPGFSVLLPVFLYWDII